MAVKVFFSYSGKKRKFVNHLYNKWRTVLSTNYIWYYNYLDEDIRKTSRRYPDHLMISRSANLFFIFPDEYWCDKDNENCIPEFLNFITYFKPPASFYNIFCNDECKYYWDNFRKEQEIPTDIDPPEEAQKVENENWAYEPSFDERWMHDLAIELKRFTIKVFEKLKEKIADENYTYLFSTYTSHSTIKLAQQRYQDYLEAYLQKDFDDFYISPSALRMKPKLEGKELVDSYELDKHYIGFSKNLLLIHDNDAKMNKREHQLNSCLDEIDELAKIRVILLNPQEAYTEYKEIKNRLNYHVLEELCLTASISISDQIDFLQDLISLLEKRHKILDKKTYKHLFLDEKDVAQLKTILTSQVISNISEAFVMIKFLSHDTMKASELSMCLAKLDRPLPSCNNLDYINQYKKELRAKILASIDIQINPVDASTEVLEEKALAILKEVILFNHQIKLR